ncbi:MAG: bifunctional DNA-formamidopyrimidine glycosylase/DNA-(apurinic or apyrimidinic site) lyase [Alphaproteobacteria bacterium]
MPELPEVEIVKRGLEGAILDGVVTDVTLNRPDLRFPIPPALPVSLQGRRIVSLRRRGKYIVGFADSGDGFVLHLGMSGVVKIIPPGDIYKPEKHDHVVMRMGDGGVIVYHDPRRFGFLDAVHVDSWEGYPAFAAMGPEPLGNDFSGEVLAAALEGRKVPIKNALLDQKIVAGIGNIYACEALFMARISPERVASSVQGVRAERLAVAVRDVLRAAIESGGSSLKDYYHTDGSLGYFQHNFKVYDREGAMIDGQYPVKRIVQGGRSTFYCPALQK